MARWNLSDLSKMPAAVQSQIYAEANALHGRAVNPKPGPSVQADETPPKPNEAAINPDRKALGTGGKPYAQLEKDGVWSSHTGTPLDNSPVYVPASLLRYILENWGSAFHVASTETQRRRVVDHAVQCLAARDANPK